MSNPEDNPTSKDNATRVTKADLAVFGLMVYKQAIKKSDNPWADYAPAPSRPDTVSKLIDRFVDIIDEIEEPPTQSVKCWVVVDEECRLVERNAGRKKKTFEIPRPKGRRAMKGITALADLGRRTFTVSALERKVWQLEGCSGEIPRFRLKRELPPEVFRYLIEYSPSKRPEKNIITIRTPTRA